MSEETKNMRLSEQAAAEFAQASGDERDALRRELEETASRFTSPVSLYEGGKLLLICWIIGGLLFCGWGVAGKMSTGMVGKVGSLALGVFMIAFPLYKLSRMKNAVMTLTATGVLFANAQQELPWSDVDNIDIYWVGAPMRTQTQLHFYLEDGAEPPTLPGGRRVRYIAKKNMVQFVVMKYRGFNDKKLMEMLENAHNAGIARAMLKEM